ncbi:HEPN domain-containing protein [Syntrophomonas curvata]
MPSKAYNSFKKNIKQVDKLIEAFTTMRPPTRGRKHLDHFTRAALIFLCSSWEVYIEQISLEAGLIISNRINDPGGLPLTVQKNISGIIKNSKHNLEPVFAANNWKLYYCNQIRAYTDKLNTPKKDKVMELFNKYLGVSGERIQLEVPSLSKVNNIVRTRGEIAHNVFAEDYLKKELVLEYYDIIKAIVVEIELLLWNYIPEVTYKKKPWQNTY